MQNRYAVDRSTNTKSIPTIQKKDLAAEDISVLHLSLIFIVLKRLFTTLLFASNTIIYKS